MLHFFIISVALMLLYYGIIGIIRGFGSIGPSSTQSLIIIPAARDELHSPKTPNVFHRSSENLRLVNFGEADIARLLLILIFIAFLV